MTEPRCQSCNFRFDEHLGVQALCKLVLDCKGELIAVHSIMADMPEFAESEFRRRLSVLIDRLDGPNLKSEKIITRQQSPSR